MTRLCLNYHTTDQLENKLKTEVAFPICTDIISAVAVVVVISEVGFR